MLLLQLLLQPFPHSQLQQAEQKQEIQKKTQEMDQ
jgi:hypothetical protein